MSGPIVYRLVNINEWFGEDYVNQACSAQRADVTSHATRQAVWAVVVVDEDRGVSDLLTDVACRACGDFFVARGLQEKGGDRDLNFYICPNCGLPGYPDTECCSPQWCSGCEQNNEVAGACGPGDPVRFCEDCVEEQPDRLGPLQWADEVVQ